MMPRAYCTPEQRDLFTTRAGLPLPSQEDPFFRFHDISRRREDDARKRGDCRKIGGERSARRAFTERALGRGG